MYALNLDVARVMQADRLREAEAVRCLRSSDWEAPRPASRRARVARPALRSVLRIALEGRRPPAHHLPHMTGKTTI